MKKVTLLSAVKTVLTIVLFTGILTACSNSTSSGEEEHEPIGFVIFEGNTQLVSKILSDDGTANISIEAGSTSNLRVAFIDVEDDIFTPDKNEHSLRFQTTDGNGSVSITQGNSDEPFFFTLTGDTEGNASFSFELLHVGSAEFGPATVFVNVTASN